jgi:hypothetical protein
MLTEVVSNKIRKAEDWLIDEENKVSHPYATASCYNAYIARVVSDCLYINQDKSPAEIIKMIEEKIEAAPMPKKLYNDLLYTE